MHKLRLLSLLTLFAILVGQGQGFAQEVAEQPCDPQVYKQMSSRAWLESEREIMQNQNLIFKADSVLEYTCFDQFLSLTAWPGGNIFTHNKTFFDGIILPRGEETGLEFALERVVFNPFASYRTSNFNHWLLGGRGEFLGLGIASGTKIIPPSTEQTYACNIMAQVWQTAKCLNFVHNGRFNETDSFYPFKEIVAIDGESIAGYEDITDTRQYPTDMACETEQGVTTWDLASLEAANEQEIMYLFQSPLGELFLDVFEKTEPGNCGPAVLTGVQVVLAEGPAHQDGVCTNPGCTFTAGGACN